MKRQSTHPKVVYAPAVIGKRLAEAVLSPAGDTRDRLVFDHIGRSTWRRAEQRSTFRHLTSQPASQPVSFNKQPRPARVCQTKLAECAALFRLILAATIILRHYMGLSV